MKKRFKHIKKRKIILNEKEFTVSMANVKHMAARAHIGVVFGKNLYLKNESQYSRQI